MAFCRTCGAEILDEAEICPKCGVRQKLSAVADKSRMTAGILALLLGGFGIHKFYMGKTLQGLLYLVFCWAFIPAIIGFIEGLIYLFESDEAFSRRI
jgi:TM2 domain-containing membrane protein YozV